MSKSEQYGVAYLQIIFPKGHLLEWVKFCAITAFLPHDLQRVIEKETKKLNKKFKNVIICPIDNRIQPGVVTQPESIKAVGNEMVQAYKRILEFILSEDKCYKLKGLKETTSQCGIRCVYTIAELPKKHMEKCESAHYIGSYPDMIKLGTTLTKSSKRGTFQV